MNKNMGKKPSDNIIPVEKGSIIVKTLDEVLNLLDKDWLVEKEINGNIFVMSKKKAPV
jgi:hypothetical protein